MTAKIWRVIVFAILIVAWLFCHSALAYEMVQTESKDFHLRSGATLSLILFSGNVEIHPWNKEEVQLSLRKWVIASSR